MPHQAFADKVEHRVLNEALPQIIDTSGTWQASMEIVMILSPLGPELGAVKATTTVYPYVNAAGEVRYVGITNNLARRAAERFATKGSLKLQKNVSGLARADAKAVEQALIETYKLGKEGGTLMNKINSVARSNPAYAQQLTRGYEILKSIGF